MDPKSPIATQRLTKVYHGGRGAFDLEFTVREGEIFGFLGPNGAGKTTTIRSLIGLLRPTRGSASVFGFDCWRESAATRARIGFVPADPHLYDRMTGSAFLDFMTGYRPRGGMDRARRLAVELDLDLRPRIRQLSRGNRQKLVLIQGLMHDAPLLVLDEASGGLDPIGQAAFLTILAGERARGKTVFLSSHNLAEVERIADRVGIIREGRMVAIEAVDRLRAMRARRMELVLEHPLPKGFFDGLEGVRILASDDEGRHLELAVRGSPTELLGRLASVTLVDLVFPPADLESVFLQYYEGGGPTPVTP